MNDFIEEDLYLTREEKGWLTIINESGNTLLDLDIRCIGAPCEYFNDGEPLRVSEMYASEVKKVKFDDLTTKFQYVNFSVAYTDGDDKHQEMLFSVPDFT